MNTLLYLKLITNKIYCIAQGILLNVIWQPGWEGSLEEKGYIYICMAEFLCCLLETTTTLLIGYTPIKSKKFKKKKSKNALLKIFGEFGVGGGGVGSMSHCLLECLRNKPFSFPKNNTIKILKENMKSFLNYS